MGERRGADEFRTLAIYTCQQIMPQLSSHAKLPSSASGRSIRGLENAGRTNETACKSIAREAIESWLQHCRKVSRHQAITEFAIDFAGSEFDLDSQLETAAAEHLGGVNPDLS
jgi:hypothetical protein